MAYLKNSIVDFTNRTLNGYDIEDYFTFDLKKILEYIDTCTDDFFEWYQLDNDDKLERLSLELYGDADYWDILLVINGRDALFDMPYNFDTIDDFADSYASAYRELVGIHGLTVYGDDHNEHLKEQYVEKFRKEHDAFRVIRVVKASRMQEFIQKAYEHGCFV